MKFSTEMKSLTGLSSFRLSCERTLIKETFMAGITFIGVARRNLRFFHCPNMPDFRVSTAFMLSSRHALCLALCFILVGASGTLQEP